MRGKRSNPAELLREKQAIVKDMESRVAPDPYTDPTAPLPSDPETTKSRNKRINRMAVPPVVSGGAVVGYKKNNTPV